MPPINLRPYWQTRDRSIRLYHGDVLQTLARLPSKSVQTVVTSPPYWGLRDYQTDKQFELGCERVPDEYVARMVAVFRELRRVLRDDGTFWLNLGDSYGTGGKNSNGESASTQSGGRINNDRSIVKGLKRTLPPGNLTGIPWRVALALQADGWILRQDIIWAKPSPMPESCKNRCTKAHEYLFLLTKQQRYFYDNEAIKEKYKDGTEPGTVQTVIDHTSGAVGKLCGNKQFHVRPEHGAPTRDIIAGSGANKRSVWTIPSQGYPGAHFATFPPKLVEPCILAGTSAHGACIECGAPWQRVVEEKKLTRPRPNDYVKRTGAAGTGNSCANSVAGVNVKTVGWEPTCDCKTEKVQPCVVLDPFIGSGTTAEVSLDHNRHCWGIDLSEQYLRYNAIPRIEGAIQSRPGLGHLVKGPEYDTAEFGDDAC